MGVVNDPYGSTTWRKEVIVTNKDGTQEEREIDEKINEDKFKFNIEYAKHFGDLTLRGGIIQSTGGIGLDYNLLNSHIQLSLEAFDFGRSTNPYLRGRLAIVPWKYFYIVGGSSDFINYKEPPIYFLGAGISFTDDDLKYIFSFMPSVGSGK